MDLEQAGTGQIIAHRIGDRAAMRARKIRDGNRHGPPMALGHAHIQLRKGRRQAGEGQHNTRHQRTDRAAQGQEGEEV